MALYEHQRQEVLDLRAQGLTYREIVRKTGHGRQTIRNIILGLRPKKLPAPAPTLVPAGLTYPVKGPFSRCGTCGGKVVMPCEACKLRVLMEGDDPPRRMGSLRARGDRG